MPRHCLKSILVETDTRTRRTGNLLIFRWTPLGIRRPRLETTRSWRISSRMAACRAVHSSGGKSDPQRKSAANHPDGVNEPKPVWIFLGLQRGLGHQVNNSAFFPV